MTSAGVCAGLAACALLTACAEHGEADVEMRPRRKLPVVAETDSDRYGGEIRGRATVVDGDGLEIRGRKIRLFGIDAPEAEQYCERGDGTRWPCGDYAAVALDRLIAGREVVCTIRDRDRYGRPVAVCRADGRDLAAALASAGWALAYRRFSTDYVSHENRARRNKVGIWAGRFDAPWSWRERRRQL